MGRNEETGMFSVSQVQNRSNNIDQWGEFLCPKQGWQQMTCRDYRQSQTKLGGLFNSVTNPEFSLLFQNSELIVGSSGILMRIK